MNNVFIYALSHPTTNEVRYIGKSKHPKKRYSEHLSKARTRKYENRHLGHWINQLSRTGLKPILTILEECHVDVWKEREKHHISTYENLVNMNEGGIEPPVTTGRVKSAEELAKLSAHRKGIPRHLWDSSPHPALGKPSPCRGQKRSAEFCLLMREQKLKNNGMRGTKRTPEQIRASSIHIMKPVYLVDDKGNILKQYESAVAAQKELSLSRGAVTRVCKGEYIHTKGYKFKYVPRHV
jgi:group I intron endonuclease